MIQQGSVNIHVTFMSHRTVHVHFRFIGLIVVSCAA